MRLRPMTMADADKMFEWKNDPVTLQNSITTLEPILRTDHLKYLEANLQYFEIIEAYDSQPCGAVRIKDNEVSIWVDDKFRKRGIATYILEEISEPGMTAKIVVGNIASLRAFIRAGFLPVSLHTTATKQFYIFKR